MLTSFDDYPIHASSSPVNETGSSDINHYDRYFFNGYRNDASLYFGVAMGLYPNRHISDASFSIVVDGREQISLHASQRADSDRAKVNNVGPIRVIVLEPMKSHRIIVDSPEHSLQADLVFTARSGPIQEPHFLVKAGQRTVFDYTRLTQFGRWSGWIEVDGKRHEFDALSTSGSRDRSWGVRPVGPTPDLGAPAGERQFYWLWAPINFETFATHFDVNEYASGGRWHQTGFLVPDGEKAAHEMSEVEYRVKWRSGTRWAENFEIDLIEADRGISTVKLEPLYEFHMLGLGYGHPEWGHGHWKGEAAVGYERWDLPTAQPCAPQNIHIQAVCRATMGEQVGIGILEQLVIGPHEPSGLAGMIDPAK